MISGRVSRNAIAPDITESPNSATTACHQRATVQQFIAIAPLTNANASQMKIRRRIRACSHHGPQARLPCPSASTSRARWISSTACGAPPPRAVALPALVLLAVAPHARWNRSTACPGGAPTPHARLRIVGGGAAMRPVRVVRTITVAGAGAALARRAAPGALGLVVVVAIVVVIVVAVVAHASSAARAST